MNIKEYISSGIVESYVLGLADATEKAEFESMCIAHDEVRIARNEFEILLEQLAFSNLNKPPEELQGRIFAEIETEISKSSSRVIPFSKNINTEEQADKAVKYLRMMRLAVAASLILFIASATLNLYFFNRSKNYLALYNNLVASQQEMAASNKVLEARLQIFQNDLAILKDPQLTIVKLPGTNVPTSPARKSLATVYWNQGNKEVYLLVNNMPQPAPGKQYQLWALVDGKPVDAGVFDTGTESSFVKMKNIPNAQAFAITLENTGGSSSPTMEQMYVLGNVKT